MPNYNLLEYSDIYSKISGNLFPYYRDEQALGNNGAVVYFTNDNTTDSFRVKEITDKTGNGGTKNVEILVPLKYLSSLRKTFEIPLINFEIDLALICSANCVISFNSAVNQAAMFAIADTKLYVPVVTLSTEDKSKLLR